MPLRGKGYDLYDLFAGPVRLKIPTSTYRKHIKAGYFRCNLYQSPDERKSDH